MGTRLRQPGQRLFEWMSSWRMLVLCSTLFMVGSLLFAAVGLVTLPADQGHAADFAGVAFLFFGAVGVLVFVGSLPLAYILKRGGHARTVAALVVGFSGLFVYVSSGYFVGFLPVAILGLVVSAFALSEEYLN